MKNINGKLIHLNNFTYPKTKDTTLFQRKFHFFINKNTFIPEQIHITYHACNSADIQEFI